MLRVKHTAARRVIRKPQQSAHVQRLRCFYATPKAYDAAVVFLFFDIAMFCHISLMPAFREQRQRPTVPPHPLGPLSARG